MTMRKEKSNILVSGLLSTGSTALIDMLREYENLQVIPGEFNDFKTPGLVADQLSFPQNIEFLNKIDNVTDFKKKIQILYNAVLPIIKFNVRSVKGIRFRLILFVNRIKELTLLKKLNRNLVSNATCDEKILFANKWIQDIGYINAKNKDHVVFNNALSPVIDSYIWTTVFHPCKLIIVFRNPKDQLADIIKKGYLFAPYGAPYMNHGGNLIETIYGRSRKSAIKFQIDAIKKRMEWIDTLKVELEPDKFLLVDFEGLVNNYKIYRSVVENFIGDIKCCSKKYKMYFEPTGATKNIGIYKEYLSSEEIELTNELENWYVNMIKNNQILPKAFTVN